MPFYLLAQSQFILRQAGGGGCGAEISEISPDKGGEGGKWVEIFQDWGGGGGA